MARLMRLMIVNCRSTGEVLWQQVDGFLLQLSVERRMPFATSLDDDSVSGHQLIKGTIWIKRSIYRRQTIVKSYNNVLLLETVLMYVLQL